jgi:enoyl-[acyl-carrier protein] reductase/trans-2-enoyl-CoA reductase (NAD+)
MIIEPRIRSNVCITAHPLGCQAQVRAQIHYVQSQPRVSSPKRVLVIGASNGYGLAARIVSAFSSGAATLGVALEKPSKKARTATAGWYNIEAFKQEAESAGLGAWNINGDAFSDETKQQVIERIKSQLTQVDLVIYSIAAPRRQDPQTGELYSSVIKPIHQPFTSKTVDFLTGRVSEVTAEPATADEIAQTVKVMGGEDWLRWIHMLQEARVLSEQVLTIAFSYIGPEFTQAIYREGTIGRAKEDLELTVEKIDQRLAPLGGKALISINKALVTRASAVIPAVPLYIALLYKVMKAKKLHEGCIQQMNRLYHDFLFAPAGPVLDDKGRIRLDDWEMRADVQGAVKALWGKTSTENIQFLSDIKGLRDEFLRHHGFGMPGVDYSQDVDANMF